MSKSVNKARVVGLYRVAVELVRSKCKVNVEVSDYARNRSKTRDYGPRACSVLSAYLVHPPFSRLCALLCSLPCFVSSSVCKNVAVVVGLWWCDGVENKCQKRKLVFVDV